MKQLIYKVFMFVAPFMLLYLINYFFYNQSQGDLVRLGYLYTNPSPKQTVMALHTTTETVQFSKKYQLVSEIDLKNKSTFDVVTIGDSFSGQDIFGYKNYLAHQELSVLHVDKFLSYNPIQNLSALINADFFDTVHADYVVLQSVERVFLQRFKNFNLSESLSIDSLETAINLHVKPNTERTLPFFDRNTFKIPITNMEYAFKAKPQFSKTYKLPLNRDTLFTGNPNNILVYQDDIDYMPIKNDLKKMTSSVEILNTINDMLAEKGMTLIVLISPDKYDLYHPYIADQHYSNTPLFYQHYKAASKSYLTVDAFRLLSNSLKDYKDVYYYDDTHWSPVAAKIIANKISALIQHNK